MTIRNLASFTPFKINAEEVVGGRGLRQRGRGRATTIEAIPEIAICYYVDPIIEEPIPIDEDPLCFFDEESGFYVCA